ncbi:hypothetical protein UJ101_00846 [Flavobacteriaceae bacterium UJ101]|nr:hypothetical protein UJ101_00846 [Flavobacteriaceae bacterium UJ101]
MKSIYLKYFVSLLCICYIFSQCSSDDDNSNAVPSKVQLISPTKSQSCINYDVTFQWSNSFDADGDDISYILKIYDDATLSSSQDITTSNTSETVNLEFGKTYYWNVIASDGSNQSQSDTNEFTTCMEDHNPVQLLYPDTGQTCVNPNINFKWSKASINNNDNIEYTLRLYDDYQTNPNSFTDQTLNKNQFELTLETDKEYAWQIISHNGNTTIESEIKSFTTCKEDHNPVQLIYPSTNVSCISPSINFQWGNASVDNEESIEYILQILDEENNTQEYTLKEKQKEVILDFGKNYSWKVISNNGNTTMESELREFSTCDEDHNPVQLIYPPTGQTCINNDVTFQWTKASINNEENMNYTLQVFDDYQNNPDSYESYTLSENQKNLVLKMNKQYAWKVVSNNGNTILESDIKSFTTCKEDHNPVQLIYPANGQLCAENDITFQWGEASTQNTDNIQYTFMIYTDYENNIFEEIQTSENTLSKNLEKGKAYYWKVISDNGNSTMESELFSFYTEENTNSDYAPYAPQLVAPSSDISSGAVTLEWTCKDIDSEKLTYTIYFGTEEKPSQIIADNIEDSSFEIQTEANMTYYWFIKAHDDTGNSTQGQVWSFNTLE